MWIKFKYRGKRYRITLQDYDLGVDYIRLPDGTVLEIDGWEESFPPHPIIYGVASSDRADGKVIVNAKDAK